MNYDFIADRIEVRSLEENNKPRYVVKGTALVANKQHIYEFTKNKDGSYKTLKSLFTPHCIKSIKEQAQHKRLFVDTQHELVRDASIKSIVKGKLTPEEEKRIANMLERRKLPLAKVTDINILDDKLDIETELNPMFREIDDEHQKYFDAVWYSLQNKYLNGISVNFSDAKVIEEENGDTKIDDINILGFSYLDAPADSVNSIYEVAIRAIEDRTGERKMEDEKVRLEQEKSRLEEERKQVEKEKADIQKQKDDLKKAELDKQAADQKRIQDELFEKTEALKRAEEEKNKLRDELTAKGTAKQIQPPYQPSGGKVYNDGFYKENLKNITSEHDQTMEVIKRGQMPMIDNSMKGFSELINLQAKAGDYTADLDKDNADYVRQNRLLDRAGSDVVLDRTKRI